MFKLNKKYDIQTPSQKVLAVAMNKDSSLCAAGDRDGITHIIDMQNGEIVRKLKQHVEFVYAMALDPDTDHLITTGKDKSLRVWDMQNGTFLRDLAGIFTSASARTMNAQSLKATTKSHTKTVTAIACDNEGRMATGGQDARVKYWVNGEPMRSYEWHSGPISCVRFQPETHLLFSASKDKSIRSWNADNGAMVHKYQCHEDEVVSFAFITKDRFVSVDASGVVLLWDVENEKALGELYRAPGQVQSMALDADKNLLILGLEDGRLIGLDISGDKPETKQAMFTIEDHEFAVRAIDIRNDVVATSDNAGKVKIWTIEQC